MNVKYIAVLILYVCCLIPGDASEVGILFDEQYGSSQAFAGGDYRQEASKPHGFGIRGAYTVKDLWTGQISVTGTYHPPSSGNFIQDLPPNPSQNFGSYKTSYIALGFQIDWKRAIDLHVGIDIRREHLYTPDLFSNSTNYTRPWVSAGIGRTFRSPGPSPIIRIEGAYALTHKSLGASWNEEDLLKAMAPRSQIALYFGWSF